MKVLQNIGKTINIHRELSAMRQYELAPHHSPLWIMMDRKEQYSVRTCRCPDIRKELGLFANLRPAMLDSLGLAAAAPQGQARLTVVEGAQT